MTDLEDALRRICRGLDALDVRYALVGGLAVSIRAEPRLTRDADLAVAVRSDAEAEAVVGGLRSRGFAVDAIVEQDTVGRLATVRLVGNGGRRGVVTDLLFASCGIEPEIVSGAEVVDVLPDLRLPVASVGHLVAMKLLARDDRRRPADADDLHALAALSTAADWRVATSAVELIMLRGFGRGRDLVQLLRELRTQGGEPG